MDFNLSTEHQLLMRKVDDFVQDRLIPLEQDHSSFDAHENVREDLLQALRQESKHWGFFRRRCPKPAAGWA